MARDFFKKIRLYVYAGMFLAMTFVVTAYVLHIPVPATGGYIHLGDTFLYLSASLLPMPFGAAAGALGEALSDALTGSLVYAVPTLLIKSAMALCFTAKGGTVLGRRNMIAVAPAGLLCVGGYYLTEAVLLHSFVSPLLEVPLNALQAVSSGAIYLLVGYVFDRARMKNRLGFGNFPR